MQHFYILLFNNNRPYLYDIYSLWNAYLQLFLYKCNTFLHLHMVPTVLWLLTSFRFFKKEFFSIACSLRDSQNLFMQSLPLYITWLFSISMFLFNDIIDIEKPYVVCSPTFVLDEFSGLSLHLFNIFC